MKKYTSTFHYPVFACIALLTVSCSGRHYHQPRVRVDVDNVKTASGTKEDAVRFETTTAKYFDTERSTVNTQTEPVLVSTEKKRVTHKEHTPVVKQEQKQKPVMKENTLKKASSYTEKMKDHRKIMKVQDIQKTQILGWIIGMILLFVGFVIFIALALIFLYIIVAYVPYTIFLIIAIVLGVAAILFLILGLADVFTPGV